MATVPVSEPMLPARICRIKSGSRIVPFFGASDFRGLTGDFATKRKAILCTSAQK